MCGDIEYLQRDAKDGDYIPDSKILTVMITSISPKLPMRNREKTKEYYINQLGFSYIGSDDFAEYLIVEKDGLQLHFFLFRDLDPLTNYGQVYIRVNDIQMLYKHLVEKGVQIHPNGALQAKPWGQTEFSLLDPDHNLLTFGQSSSHSQ